MLLCLQKLFRFFSRKHNPQTALVIRYAICFFLGGLVGLIPYLVFVIELCKGLSVSFILFLSFPSNSPGLRSSFLPLHYSLSFHSSSLIGWSIYVFFKLSFPSFVFSFLPSILPLFLISYLPIHLTIFSSVTSDLICQRVPFFFFLYQKKFFRSEQIIHGKVLNLTKIESLQINIWL